MWGHMGDTEGHARGQGHTGRGTRPCHTPAPTATRLWCCRRAGPGWCQTLGKAIRSPVALQSSMARSKSLAVPDVGEPNPGGAGAVDVGEPSPVYAGAPDPGGARWPRAKSWWWCWIARPWQCCISASQIPAMPDHRIPVVPDVRALNRSSAGALDPGGAKHQSAKKLCLCRSTGSRWCQILESQTPSMPERRLLALPDVIKLNATSTAFPLTPSQWVNG